MKKWLMAAALAVAGLAAADAQAQVPAPAPAPGYNPAAPGSCPANNCAPAPAPVATYAPPVTTGGKHSSHLWTHSGMSLFSGGGISRMPTLPVYMAAPWYLYWPYDGHFQTIAPMAHGLYYPPPLYTGNPYLPGAYPGYVPGNPVPAVPVAPLRP